MPHKNRHSVLAAAVLVCAFSSGACSAGLAERHQSGVEFAQTVTTADLVVIEGDINPYSQTLRGDPIVDGDILALDPPRTVAVAWTAGECNESELPDEIVVKYFVSGIEVSVGYRACQGFGNQVDVAYLRGVLLELQGDIDDREVTTTVQLIRTD